VPANICRACKRALRDPSSVRMGIGPVCRARDNRQGVFDFMRARVKLLRHECGRHILVRDVGHKTGRSVIDDAEFVVGQLYMDYGITDGTRIFCEDSEGRVDELLHARRKFRGYRAGHEGVDMGSE